MILMLDFFGVLYDSRRRADGGESADPIFEDVREFLDEHKADKLLLISSGAPEVVGPKLDDCGIKDYFDSCIFTAGRPKGEVLAERPEFLQEDIVIVDDNPRELDSIASALPGAALVLMERFPEEASLTISEYDTVSNLTELEAFIDAREELESE